MNRQCIYRVCAMKAQKKSGPNNNWTVNLKSVPEAVIEINQTTKDSNKKLDSYES